MNAKDFERRLAADARITAGEADQRIRPLRQQGRLEFGGRGPHAKSIDAADATLMLFSMVSRRAVDSYSVAIQAMALEPVLAEGMAGFETLFKLVANQLSEPGFPLIERLMIDEEGQTAWTLVKVGGQEMDLAWARKDIRDQIAADPETYDALGSGFMGRRFVIGGARLRHYALVLQKRETADVVVPAQSAVTV